MKAFWGDKRGDSSFASSIYLADWSSTPLNGQHCASGLKTPFPPPPYPLKPPFPPPIPPCLPPSNPLPTHPSQQLPAVCSSFQTLLIKTFSHSNLAIGAPLSEKAFDLMIHILFPCIYVESFTTRTTTTKTSVVCFVNVFFLFFLFSPLESQ